MRTKKLDMGWATLIAALMTALLSLAGTAYIQATHTDVADHVQAMTNEHRITALEQGHADDHEKLNDVQTQVHKLVDYFMGSKK